MEGFKTRALVNYIDRVYQPIEKDKELMWVKWEFLEKGETSKLSRKNSKYLNKKALT